MRDTEHIKYWFYISYAVARVVERSQEWKWTEFEGNASEKMFEVVDRAVEFIDNDKEQERGVLVVTGVNDKNDKNCML